MRIGFLVDGEAEYYSLPELFRGLNLGHELLKPLLCPMQPLSTPGQIAYVASKRFSLLLGRRVDRIVILIDKEDRQECTGEFAAAIAEAARDRLASMSPNVELLVVVKVRKYENWLVADPVALRRLPGLFKEVRLIAKEVTPGRADRVDGLALLKRSARERGFDKRRGAIAICQKLDSVRARRNSTSFDKFLRALGSAPVRQSRPKKRARRLP